MLHFQGLLSEWQPLWRKYKVWSGNAMPQKTHCSARPDLLWGDRHPVESEGCSGPVEVMVPFVVVAMG